MEITIRIASVLAVSTLVLISWLVAIAPLLRGYAPDLHRAAFLRNNHALPTDPIEPVADRRNGRG
ncbi:MAG: hypothetical protein SFX72_19695 [Isosphaeraceae bacterium]|nr:hypothetical protein [Isosphaeraceae bacterium]